MADEPKKDSPKKDKDGDTQLLLGKFKSADDLAAAYQELEKKLGAQGDELGQFKKQVAEAQRALQAYAEQLAALKPYADWYAANEQALKLYQQWLQAQQQPHAAPAAGGTAPTTPQRGNLLQELLTPEERQALFLESAKMFDERVFKPWVEQFQRQLQALADERERRVAEQIQQQQRAFTEVLWRTMQRGLPEDKVKAMREWHEQALRLAQLDDPMKAADEWLSLRSRSDELEQKLKALEAEREKWQKSQMPALTGSEPAPWAAPSEEAPKSRQERFQRVLADTKERVGPEAVREFFGSRV